MDKLKTIKDLIALASYNTNDNTKIIDYLVQRFSPFSKEIIKVKNPTNNKYNLIVGINTSVNNTNAIVLSGHIDTVVADEQAYNTCPTQATIINGKIYGLGVIDMKCFFASIIDNLEFLSNCNYPIIVVITCDEETDLLGINTVVKTLQTKNVKPCISIIGEPTNMTLCNTSKSCYEYILKVTGKSCHSSNPLNGINANYIIAKLVCKIEELNNKYLNTTLSCGIINGGEKANIVPYFSTATFDIRSDNKQTVDIIIAELNKEISVLTKQYKGCTIELVNILAIPALENKPNKLINQIVNKFNLNITEFVGGCEAGYLQQLGGEAFIFGTGDLALAHKPNEFMIIKDFEKYNKLFCEIIEYICTIVKH